MSFINSLSVAGVGLLVVFAGLAIIILFISLLSLANRQRKKEAPKAAEKPAAAAPAPVVQVAPTVSEGVSGDVLAAIVAAISAMMENKQGFIVRRVKRVSDVPAWSRAGREEQTYSRL